jgi:DamX protein
MRTEPSFSTEPVDPLTERDAEAPASQLLADYRQRYGLSVDPFEDDPHFPFYSGAQRRQILDQLLHLCQFSHNLLVVVGEFGVGKTRMAQALIDALDDADDICFIEGQINSTYESLLGDMLEQFELPDENSFSGFAQKQSEQDGLLVVIVDNAHHLTDDVLLALINNFGGKGDTRIHLVMFAEPHLLDRLESFNVPEVILSDFFLDKFSLSEAVDYLNFRMEMADYLGPEIFSEAKVEPWWRQAQGQLLVLHEMAQDKLLASVSVSKASGFGRRSLPLPHIIAASVLGAGLLMWYFYLNKSPAPATEQLVNPIPVNSGNNPVSSQSIAQSSAQSISSTAAINTLAPSSDSMASSMGERQSAAISASVISSEAAVVKQSVVPLVQTNSVHAEIKSKPRASSSASSAKKAADQVMKSALVESAPQKNVGIADALSEQEKAILSWGESEYTLQLVGLSSEKSARDYMAMQQNKKDLLLFKSKRQGKDWFVVVTGRYPSSAKARQAVQLLPEDQKAASPWPREVRVIQREIKQR